MVSKRGVHNDDDYCTKPSGMRGIGATNGEGQRISPNGRDYYPHGRNRTTPDGAAETSGPNNNGPCVTPPHDGHHRSATRNGTRRPIGSFDPHHKQGSSGRQCQSITNEAMDTRKGSVKRMSDRQDDEDNQTAVEERRRDSESDVSWDRLKEDTEENNGNNPYSF